MHKLERTTFESSRAGEYFDARELQTQTGQPVSNFATVALKELLDNALDACEMSGVAPEVSVGVHEEDGDSIRLAVSDNGPGIPPETVRKILNFNTRTSDKAVYRSPTRGAQGNALKTVIGIPYALGYKDPIYITGQGVRHTIEAWVDPAGAVRVSHEEKPSKLSGTRVELAVPYYLTQYAKQNFDPTHWVRSFAAFNPHATFRYQG